MRRLMRRDAAAAIRACTSVSATPRASSACSASLDEALGAAERRVALADHREAHLATGPRRAAPVRRAATRIARRRRRRRASSGTRRPCRRRSRRCRRAGKGARAKRRRAAHHPRPPFVFARRTEQREGGRSHRRRDVHRRRVDADERARASPSAPRVRKRQLAGQVDDPRTGRRLDQRQYRVDERALARSPARR